MTLVHLIVFILKWPSLDLDRVGIAVALHRSMLEMPADSTPGRIEIRCTISR